MDYIEKELKELDNLLPILNKLHKKKMKEIMEKIIEKNEITKAPRCIEVIKSDAFSTLPYFLVESLVKSDDLKVKEEIIWEKCVAWAKYAVEQKSEEKEDETGASHLYTSSVSPSPLFLLFPTISNTSQNEKIKNRA